MRMSNSPSHLLDHQLAQSHYRNSISPSSTYNSEDEDIHSEQSGNLSSTQTAVNNLLGNKNYNSSSSSLAKNTNKNQFSFAMNGTNNQTDIQQTLAAQQAANAAAQIVRKLQQHHNQMNNNSSTNNALAAAAAQLSNSNASNAFSNYSAFYNAAAALNGGDLPLLGNINNLANSLKNSVNNNHAIANVLNNPNGPPNGPNGPNSSNGTSPQSPYIATNQYIEITYKGQQVAAFLATNKEYLLCLPQAFELFLKHLVGGLHTVYTKLKRLDVVPIVCNVEQVRILRGRGAIQPGVNRCKLLSTKDFDILYKDCTTARSGRPARPNEPDSGLLSNCGVDVDLADCDVSCDERQNRRVLARLSNRLPDSLLKRHKTDLDNNMLPLLFANEDSGQGGTDSSHRSSPNGQSLLSPAAQAALRYAVRNSPGISSLHGFNGSNLMNSNSGSSTTPNTTNSNQATSNQNNNSTNQSNNNPILGSDFNATAAYLWLISQQQQQNNSNRNSSTSNGLLNGDLISPTNTNHNNSSTNGASLANNALSALNLTRSLSSLASGANSTTNQASNNSSTELLGSNNNKTNNHQLDESTDEDDDPDDEMDDSEIRSSHSNLSNSIDNHPNMFNGFKGENRTETPNTDQLNNNNQMNSLLGPTLLSNNKENDGTSNKDSNKEQLPFGQLGLTNLMNSSNSEDPFRSLNRSNNSDLKNGNSLMHSQNISSIGNNLTTSTDSLESLLRNIENLVSIAVQNARQQQQQFNLHKVEIRAELLNVAEKERQLERQLNEEQKIRLLYQKRFKKERRFRKKIEQDLQQVQNKLQQSDRNSPSVDNKANGRANTPTKSQQIKTSKGNNLENGSNSPAYGSPASTSENLKENVNEEKDSEMAVD